MPLVAKRFRKKRSLANFRRPEIICQNLALFQDAENWRDFNFLIFSGNKGHLPQLYIKKLARRQNMGVQLPLEKFWTQNRADAAHTNFGVLAPAQFWLQNTFYWELGPHAYFVDNRVRGPPLVGVGYIDCVCKIIH